MLYRVLDVNDDEKISFDEIKVVLNEILKIIENRFDEEYKLL